MVSNLNFNKQKTRPTKRYDFNPEEGIDSLDFDESKAVTNQLPQVYALWFVSAVILYSFLFAIPGIELENVGDFFPWEAINWKNFEFSSFNWEVLTWDRLTWDSLKWGVIGDRLYFSAVTITTLGYGDISPVSGWAKFVVGFESVTGLAIIGLFLNALSHQHGSEAQEEERKKIIGQITGGRSYPLVDLQIDAVTGAVEYYYRIEGYNPLYDVKVSIRNIVGFEDVETSELGVLIGSFENHKKFLAGSHSGEIELKAEYHARNGRFVQSATFKEEENGRWSRQYITEAFWAEDGAPRDVLMSRSSFYSKINKKEHIEREQRRAL